MMDSWNPKKLPRQYRGNTVFDGHNGMEFGFQRKDIPEAVRAMLTEYNRTASMDGSELIDIPTEFQKTAEEEADDVTREDADE